MRKRRAIISFPQQHGTSAELLSNQKTLGGLNIAFNVTILSQQGMGGEASIDIYNLNREDLQFLTTTAAQWVEQQSIIQLYVGYDDDIKLIFSGAVKEATPQGYPDVVLHIKAISGPQWTTKAINVQKANLKLMDLIDYTSSVTGYPINIPMEVRKTNEMLNTRIDEYSYTGSVWGLLDEIQSMCGGFTVSEKSIFLSTYNDQTYVWTPTITKGTQKLLVSEKTGLVGVPHLLNYGVEIKTLLNHKVNIGDVVHLESQRIPIATGDYFIKEINHNGELRGNNWYTTLKCSFTVAKTKGNEDAKASVL